MIRAQLFVFLFFGDGDRHEGAAHPRLHRLLESCVFSWKSAAPLMASYDGARCAACGCASTVVRRPERREARLTAKEDGGGVQEEERTEEPLDGAPLDLDGATCPCGDTRPA